MFLLFCAFDLSKNETLFDMVSGQQVPIQAPDLEHGHLEHMSSIILNFKKPEKYRADVSAPPGRPAARLIPSATPVQFPFSAPGPFTIQHPSRSLRSTRSQHTTLSARDENLPFSWLAWHPSQCQSSTQLHSKKQLVHVIGTSQLDHFVGASQSLLGRLKKTRILVSLYNNAHRYNN